MTLPALLTPFQALIARELEYWDDESVTKWAVNYAQQFNHWENDNFVKLVSINAKQKRDIEKAHSLLTAFVKSESPNFSFTDPKNVTFAKQLLASRLQSYIDDNCRPYDLCKMTNPLEQVFDYPSWMGDLYNACDWIEHATTSDDVPYLKESAKEILDTLS